MEITITLIGQVFISKIFPEPSVGGGHRLSFSDLVAGRGYPQPCQPDWESSSWSSTSPTRGRRAFLTFTCTPWRTDTHSSTVEPSLRGHS